jgi:hypothetical protein
VITPSLFRSSMLALSLVAFSLVSFAQGQTADPLPVAPAGNLQQIAAIAAARDDTPEAPLPQDQQDSQTAPQQNAPASAQQSSQTPVQSDHDRAALQVKQQEKQRILGIAPNFNTSYIADAAPLSVGQKFNLAFHSAVDPFVFFAAGVDAGYSQATDSFPAYGQGAQGFAKYFGASYVDDFDGTMIGNAILPALLKQDPRYFRKGTGTFTHRLLYSISTTVWCKNDNGKWGPNYSNVLGNLAAGGISNIYYPASDRGAGLTVERGLTVTAEGTLGAFADEFWPDVARKLLKNHFKNLQPNMPTPTAAPTSTN